MLYIIALYTPFSPQGEERWTVLCISQTDWDVEWGKVRLSPSPEDITVSLLQYVNCLYCSLCPSSIWYKNAGWSELGNLILIRVTEHKHENLQEHGPGAILSPDSNTGSLNLSWRVDLFGGPGWFYLSRKQLFCKGKQQ